ncbi:hypothetical protein [Streptomyces mirabilis]|uniref:hypothetical protein n=1 Tax=Streptomyces mirabilis TaxID=68239 RepID=UPI00365CDCAA
MAGSIPAIALAVIFGIWHAYELFQSIKEVRNNSNSEMNHGKGKSNNEKKARFDMRNVRLFMSTASAMYGWTHMAEVE